MFFFNMANIRPLISRCHHPSKSKHQKLGPSPGLHHFIRWHPIHLCGPQNLGVIFFFFFTFSHFLSPIHDTYRTYSKSIHISLLLLLLPREPSSGPTQTTPGPPRCHLLSIPATECTICTEVRVKAASPPALVCTRRAGLALACKGPCPFLWSCFHHLCWCACPDCSLRLGLAHLSPALAQALADPPPGRLLSPLLCCPLTTNLTLRLQPKHRPLPGLSV